MNEKIANFIHDHPAFIFLFGIGFVCACSFLYGRSCGIREADHNNVHGTIQQANGNINEAGTSITQAKAENESARGAVERATQTVGEVRKRTERSQAELREANKLIDECLQLNREAKAGLEDIRKTNK